MEQVIEMTQGSRYPTLRGKYTEPRGKEPNINYVPLPLTGISARLRVDLPAGVLVKDATTFDEAAGLFDVEWADGDLAVAGTFGAEIDFIDTATTEVLFTSPRFFIYVQPRLGGLA
jgi:hypothetical protein